MKRLVFWTLTISSLSALISLMTCSHALPSPSWMQYGVPPLESPRQSMDGNRAMEIDINPALLQESWNRYKSQFIQGDGRVIDRKAGGISTSEGQAYGMIRSLWMRDQETFEHTFKWAKDNLRAGGRSDHLFGWKWGQRAEGGWGLIDTTAASDADQLIALALIEGATAFSQPAYLEEARSLLADIWSKETLEVRGQRYLIPGDWTITGNSIKLNPSYLLPFAYRVFARVDRERDWNSLIDTSYEVLATCRTRVGLPTDWCYLAADSGNLTIAEELFDRSSDTGYEAFRVYWNLAADFWMNEEARALEIMRQGAWLTRYFAVRRQVPAVITPDGVPRVDHEYLGVYGAWFPALAATDRVYATLIYDEKIRPSYRDGFWGDADDYYQQNWIWFGLILYQQHIGAHKR